MTRHSTIENPNIRLMFRLLIYQINKLLIMYQVFGVVDMIYTSSSLYNWEKNRQISWMRENSFGKIKAILYINGS